MARVDLNTFDFDWSTTFSVLLMNADGTVYHRYGSRDSSSPMSHLSSASLVRLLDESVEDHEAYSKHPRPAGRRAFTVEQLPHWKRRIDKGQRPKCFHCHMVGEGYDHQAREKRTWSADMVWKYPPPDRIGLHLDRDDQSLVTQVDAATPAARAGLAKGDRLVRAGEQRIRSMADLSHVLEALPGKGASLELSWLRGEDEKTATLRLPSGWRVGEPRDLAWRADMWTMSPKPGFGGEMIDAARKRKLGIRPTVAAFEVTYIVDWGENRHTGDNARRAGIRKGDIVLSVAGRDDFESPNEYHAWFRLTQKAGRKVKIELMRDGKRRTVTLRVVD